MVTLRHAGSGAGGLGVQFGGVLEVAGAKLAPRRTRTPITAGTSSRSSESFTR
jgi:hypothetical protein